MAEGYSTIETIQNQISNTWEERKAPTYARIKTYTRCQALHERRVFNKRNTHTEHKNLI